MPPPKKARRSKKGKGKRKGRKKKKKGKKGPGKAPPPLHLLSELYRKLIDAVRTLYEMRVAARKKRVEGWFLTKEMAELKSDNELYHDYLNDNIEDLQNAIDKFKRLIQEIKDAIAKAVAARLAKLQKQLDDYERRTADLEKELADIRSQLLEFESLMVELARLMARIQELLAEIEAAKFAAELKIRHLTNQFLEERGRLHNHLEMQLFELIKNCRTYLMPILWNFMQKLMTDNRCLRWRLGRTDEKNIMLVGKREEMMRRRKILTLEKPYWDIQWAFFKLGEMDTALKKKKRPAFLLDNKYSGFADLATTDAGEAATIDAVSRLIPSTQLGKDFNVFLIQRLTAAKEAQERHEREKKREEKRFLKKLLSTVQAMKDRNQSFTSGKDMGVIVGEDEDDWEDMHEHPGYGYGEDYGLHYGEDYFVDE